MAPTGEAVRDIGRYRVYATIASGGMATVSFGRLLGPVGFARTVAVKQLHAQFAKDPEFVSMFLDEARLAARIHHPNVVATLDVVAAEGELVLVMDYVHGESLGRLLKASSQPIPHKITATIIAGALYGLHAAHEARSERGEPLGIVHRDISPQNVIVGVDGVPRVLDFGVAKAADRVQTTQEGHLKGKLRYMAPEQVRGDLVTRRADVYAMAVVLYEMITRKPLVARDEPGAVVHEILYGTIAPPTTLVPGLPAVFDLIIRRGLAKDPKDRYTDAREMAIHLEEAFGLASANQVGTWVQSLVGATLDSRAATVAKIERSSVGELPISANGPGSGVTGPISVGPDPATPSRLAFEIGTQTSAQRATSVAVGVFALLAAIGLALVVFVVVHRPPPAPVVAVAAPPPPEAAPAPTDPAPPPPPPSASALVAAPDAPNGPDAPDPSDAAEPPPRPAVIKKPPPPTPVRRPVARPAGDGDMARSRR